MDEQTQRIWMALRTKVLYGYALNEQEQAVYEAGLRQLDEEEEEMFRLNGEEERRKADEVRARIAFLEQENARLRQRLQTLKRMPERLPAETNPAIVGAAD